MTLRVSLTERVSIETRGVVIEEQRFPGRQGRLVFAYLLAACGRPVPRDELADALWGDVLPATWEKALSVLVSKLRALLSECGLDGSACLTSAFGCYQLVLPADSWVDVVVADEAATAADRALAAGDLARARVDASTAESLARGTFLPGEEGGWVEGKRAELRETLVRALDCLAEVSRLAGDSAAAIRVAEELIVLEPFRETGYRRLMEAHTVAGNPAEALRVYEQCRQLLARELGAFPSPETEAIYRSLLEAPAAPASVAVPPGGPPPETALTSTGERGVSRRAMGSRIRLATMIATVALAAGILGVLATRSGGEPEAAAIPVNSVVALDRFGSVAATVSVGARPAAITSGAGALWVVNLDDQSVTRVDPASSRAVRTIAIGETPTGVAATRTAVWVIDGSGSVSKIDPRYDRRSFARPLRGSIGFFGGTARPALAAFGSVWVLSPDGVLLRLDPVSGRMLESVAVGNLPSAIASGAGALWVTNSSDGTLSRVDPATLVIKTIPVGNGPASVAVNRAGAWVANAGDNALARVDLETNAVASTTPVGDGPAAVVATPAALWVANSRDGTVMRLDPRSGKVSKTIWLGGTPNALATAGGKVWVAVAPSPPESPPERGARLVAQDDFRSLDPAFGSWIHQATCANLVTFPDRSGRAGTRIVPEVAENMPRPTNGGTVYTFRVRPGFRFSPPSNEAVAAMTFKSTIERVTHPRLRSPLAAGFSGVVGYRAYVTGKAEGISGVVARGSTLVVRLTRPDGGFLTSLANAAACPVPIDTPVAGGMNEIPSAGPYFVASYTPRQQLVLERNPNYGGSRPQRLERIVIAVGVDPVDALEQVEAGTADYALELPRAAGPRLEAAYGPESEAAKAGHQRYFVSEALGARFLHMNTSRPLFSDVRLRRAVSFAIDRRALAAQGRRFAEINPFNAGTPTDDYIPWFFPGARDFDLYPTDGPDLPRAMRIAGPVRAHAVMYTPSLSPWREEAQIVRRNLKPLGIDVQVREFPIGDFFTRVTRRGEPFDLAVSGYWSPPDAVLFLGFLFDDPQRFAATQPASTNISHFHDDAVSRRLAVLRKLSGPERYRAASLLALELQRDLVPAAAFATTASRDFFSARIGCQTYHPVWGIDLAALCLRR